MECGSKTVYKETKPKFCSNCGKQFGIASVIKPQSQLQTQKIIESPFVIEIAPEIPKSLSYDGVVISAKRPGDLGQIGGLAKGNGNVIPIKTNLTKEAVNESLSTFYKFAKNSTTQIDMGGSDEE